jgi:phenylalanyl-tRNA synthetase beta chain
MRVPVTWLREYADVPADASGRAIAARLISRGLEVETVETAAAGLDGPLLVGTVVDFSEETHSNGKTIRWCHVDVGEPEPRGIVCGARNFTTGDTVVVALPGTVLPGGFEITARKTYGHVSDGMICSARELGIGDDHAGILVIDPAAPGSDALSLLGLDDEVLDIAVTPDRGYCQSIRGVAREAAAAYAVGFRDPAVGDGLPTDVVGPARLDDRGCDRFVIVSIVDLDPSRATPEWMARRIRLCGMRPISLLVDVTNYVMLELGQPLHAYDGTRLAGQLGVRRAVAGESLETLDGATRSLDTDDLVIVDDSGVIGLAGVMGGASTEITPVTTHVVLEAAHFDATSVARTARRHRLPSEASRRFERGVDPAVPPHAAMRAAQLLVEHGGGRIVGASDVNAVAATPAVSVPVGLPARVSGLTLDRAAVVRHLETVGCTVTGDEPLAVTPPSWRPDLTDPFDFVEEVIRLEGYDVVPALLPQARPGRGLTARQRLRRRLGAGLAARGLVETLCYPFVSDAAFDTLLVPADDARRVALRLANPLAESEPLLRTTLLPGLLAAQRRNVARGNPDPALFELGAVFRPRAGAQTPPRLGVDRRPTDTEIAALDAALPDQPERIAAVLSGCRSPSGWWGPGRPVEWADAVELARDIAWLSGVEVNVRSDEHAPWHPGRCAAVYAGDRLVGHAGELHPRVVEGYDLPPRTCAVELDLDRLVPSPPPPVPAPHLSAYPVATQDVALVVDRAVPAADVEAALRDGAGELLESIRLFDIYAGEQIGTDRKSLAFTLRFRAPDRTLTAEEASTARDSAVAEAARRTGARLRS